MSIEVCRTYLRQRGYEDRIREFDVSSATVVLAAQAGGCDAVQEGEAAGQDAVAVSHRRKDGGQGQEQDREDQLYRGDFPRQLFHLLSPPYSVIARSLNRPVGLMNRKISSTA